MTLMGRNCEFTSIIYIVLLRLAVIATCCLGVYGQLDVMTMRMDAIENLGAMIDRIHEYLMDHSLVGAPEKYTVDASNTSEISTTPRTSFDLTVPDAPEFDLNPYIRPNPSSTLILAPSRAPSLPPTTSSNVLPFPGKKGASFTLREVGQHGSWVQNLPKVIKLDPYWNYSWGLQTISEQPDNIDFVPMLWGGARYVQNRLQQTLDRAIIPHVMSNKVKALLGFNEPDKVQQSNMPVSQALEIWPELEKLNIPLCSPSCANPNGVWMQSFMEQATARGHRIDYIGVHWYAGTYVPNFQNKMRNIYNQYGQRPIVITEFAVADWSAKTPEQNRFSPGDVLDFMKQVLPWLEEQDWIAGYAWFPFHKTFPQGTSSALFDEDGNLTACGRYYASIRKENPLGDTTINIES